MSAWVMILHTATNLVFHIPQMIAIVVIDVQLLAIRQVAMIMRIYDFLDGSVYDSLFSLHDNFI